MSSQVQQLHYNTDKMWVRGLRGGAFSTHHFDGIRWYLFYIQHFTVLINHFCMLNAQSNGHVIYHDICASMFCFSLWRCEYGISVKEGHCLEQLQEEMPTGLRPHPSWRDQDCILSCILHVNFTMQFLMSIIFFKKFKTNIHPILFYHFQLLHT